MQWSFSNGDYSFNIQVYSFKRVPAYISIVALSESVFKMTVASRYREKNGFKKKFKEKFDFGVAFRQIKPYFL